MAQFPALSYIQRIVAAAETGSAITRSEATIFPDLASPSKPINITPTTAKDIMWAVCGRHGITLDMLVGRDRRIFIVVAREECARRMRGELGLTYTEIGYRLRRDYSTARNYALKQHRCG